MSEKQPVTYLVSLWNLYSLFVIVPYKIQWAPLQRTYFSESSTILKVICVVMNISTVFLSVYWLFSCFPLALKLKQEANDVSPGTEVAPLSVSSTVMIVFNVITYIAWSLKGIMFIRIMWGKQKLFLDFLSKLSYFNFQMAYWKIALMNGFMIFSASLWVGFAIQWSPFIDLRKKYFKRQDMGWLAIPFHFLNIFISFASSATLTGANFFMNFFILTMWNSGKKYKAMQREIRGSKKQLEAGLFLYSKIKDVSTLANRLTGGLVFAIYMEGITFFVDKLGSLPNMTMPTFFFFLYHALIFLVTWMMACEFHRETNNTTIEWIAECQNIKWISMDDRMRLLTLSNEITAAPIGISNQFFTMTYGFFGSILGPIFTYGLIVLQLNNNHSFGGTY